MAKRDETEVLVVGAGPVGLLTSLLLTQMGVSVRLIDQEARTAAHSYACALHPASLELLDFADLAQDVIDLGRRVDSVVLFEGPCRQGEIKLGRLPGKYPFAVVLEQSVLEDLLEQRLRNAGLAVEWNHRLQAFDMTEEGVDATVEVLAPSGRGYIIPEFELTVQSREQLSAGYVVGADGHNSLLRENLGIRSVRAGSPMLFAVFQLELNESVSPEMNITLDESTVNVMWPLGEKRCRWSFLLTPPKYAADFPQKDRDRLIIVNPTTDWDQSHHLQSFLRERAPWFTAQVQDISWTAHVQFERQLALQFGEGRCWLAGDAAHQTSPVGMQSMNMGLREGASLAGHLKSILREQGKPEQLQQYEEVFRLEWQRLLSFTKPIDYTRETARWLRRHASTLVSSLPASGTDLTQLLDQAGLTGLSVD